MKMTCDCEFDDHDGPFLSLALIREDGESFYYYEPDAVARDPWVQENVVPFLAPDDKIRKEVSCITADKCFLGDNLRAFIGDDASPVFIADSPVDIYRIAHILSTNHEGGWQPSNYPEITFLVKNVDCYPTKAHVGPQHNAYYDALALKHTLETGYANGGSESQMSCVVKDQVPLVFQNNATITK